MTQSNTRNSWRRILRTTATVISVFLFTPCTRQLALSFFPKLVARLSLGVFMWNVNALFISKHGKKKCVPFRIGPRPICGRRGISRGNTGTATASGTTSSRGSTGSSSTGTTGQFEVLRTCVHPQPVRPPVWGFTWLKSAALILTRVCFLFFCGCDEVKTRAKGDGKHSHYTTYGAPRGCRRS